jgi:hypothetical protein
MSETVVVVFSSMLTIFFLFASSIKILGWQKKIFNVQLDFFKKYGLNRQIMAAVGFVELFGALAIWLPGTLAIAGTLALLATSVGAIYCHIRFDTWKDGIPAMITLSLSAVVLYSKAATGVASL